MKKTNIAKLVLLGIVLSVSAKASVYEGVLNAGNQAIGGTVEAIPMPSIQPNTYDGPQDITFAANGADGMYYTLDGTEPTCTTGNQYQNPIHLDETALIKIVACYNGQPSGVQSYQYTINPPWDGGGYYGGGWAMPLLNFPLNDLSQQQQQPAPYVFLHNLRKGMRGPEVAELQKRLKAEGVYTCDITGYFGPQTLAGVKKYQKLHHLPPTGFVGPATRAKLNESPADPEKVAQIQQRIVEIKQMISQLTGSVQQ